MHYWSIYEIPTELIEGSEVDRLLKVFPQARQAGGNYIFVDTLNDAESPIVFESVPEDSPYTDVQLLASLLLSDDRSKAIHLSKAMCVKLDKSPEWIAWAEAYDHDQETMDSIRNLFS